MLGLSECNETNLGEKEGEGERDRQGEGERVRVGLHWAKARKKKGLLVIIKSSHTDFLPNLFPLGP